MGGAEFFFPFDRGMIRKHRFAFGLIMQPQALFLSLIVPGAIREELGE